MTGTIFLQIFLFIDVFIIGGLAVIALQHAVAHFKQPKPLANDAQVPIVADPLPQTVKENLVHASQTQFQAVLNQAAGSLQQDLKTTSDNINNLVLRLASEIVSNELERYREELSKLHNQAVGDLSGIKQQMVAHETELKAKVAQEYEAEKQRLIKQIDTKLADAVSSFLLETLKHNVDLGSQSTYLIDTLEEHKAEFAEEVTVED
jgi:hypothetical protein